MTARIVLLLATLLLAGCSSETPDSSTDAMSNPSGKVPASCEIATVVSEFEKQVPGSEYVPTDWQPSPDTDLAAALENQGIACTYGIQVAEIGGTILWASNANNVWNERKLGWIDQGETYIDLPGIDESATYILQEGTSADEMHVWRINILIHGMWIQVGASFLRNVEDALPIIKAAIQASM